MSTPTVNIAGTGNQRGPLPSTALAMLFVFAGLFYLLCLPLSELRASDESIYAAIAGDMLQNGHYLTPHFDGAPCHSFVLYPWLTLLCSGFQMPTTFSVRLPALLSTFGLAILAGRLSARHHDRNSGLTAAMIVLTSFAVMRICIVAQTETLHAFLLTSAWFWLYENGPQKQLWQRAWGGALGLVFLDMLNVGIRAPILFYLPLLLTSMPPKLRRQMQHSAHIGWLITFALLFYLWETLMCQQPIWGWNAYPSNAAVDESLLRHLCTFPFKCIMHTMPWGLLIWAPFCLGLRPLEPTGSIGGFLRSLVLCPFILYWLLPGYSTLFLLCSLAPLAVLISFHTQVIFRRYDRQFHRIFNVFGILSVTALALCALFWGTVALGCIRIIPAADAHPHQWLRPMTCVLAVISIALAIKTLTTILHSRLELKVGWCAIAARFTYVAIMLPVLFLTLQDRRYVAKLLRSELPLPPELASSTLPTETFSQYSDEIGTVYLLGNSGSFPAQMFYFGKPIKRITRLAEELPKDEEVVYLLSRTQPVLPERTWTALSPAVNMNMLREFRQEYQLTRSGLTGLITRQPTDDTTLPRYLPPDALRLYRGKRI